MVRTRSDCSGVRISTKAPRKTPTTTLSSLAGKSSKKNDGGGNSVCPRETPPWQKEITKFFPTKNDAAAVDCTETASGESSSSSQTPTAIQD